MPDPNPLRRFTLPPDRFREFRHRWQRVVVLSISTGTITGITIVGFETLTVNVLLDRVRELPDELIVIIPAVGLVGAWAALRWLGAQATPGVGDEYLREYHGWPVRHDIRSIAGRFVASVSTLGAGGAMGFEGPSIYLGATIGSRIQARYHRYFRRTDTHVLLVAGAAAGVAAIFKAPATGAVFALEVPYQQDNASHAVLPALVASASSYLTFIAVKGTGPLLEVAGNPGFDTRDLLGAIALGLLCGFGARIFAGVINRAKDFQRRSSGRRRILVGGGGLVLAATVAVVAFSEPLTIGPGYQAIQWSLDPNRATLLVALLFAVEAMATVFTVAGGGAGGLFIPLVVQGWLVGRVVEGLVATHTTLFPVVGAAAYLGAGYRTPIAGVVFVAEATGRPGFIVPALVSTSVSQLLMGRKSVSTYQIPRRVGRLDRRLEQPVSVAMIEPPLVCQSTSTLDELWTALPDRDVSVVPIVEDGTYCGSVLLTEVIATPHSQWEDTKLGDLVKPDLPAAGIDWTLRRALTTMQEHSLNAITVIDGERRVRGLLAAADVLALEPESDEG